MLELVLGGVLEAAWSDLGRFLGGQDAHKTAQDGHKTPQDATMTVQDGPKTRPRCSQDAPKTPSRRKLRQVSASEAEERKNIEKTKET